MRYKSRQNSLNPLFLSLSLLVVLFSIFFNLFSNLETIEYCFQKSGIEKRDCLNSYFYKLTFKVNSAYALDRAKEIKDNGQIPFCHMVGHVIGQANFDKHNSDVATAIATCSTTCVNACQHGVIERYLQSSINLVDSLSKLPGLCSSLPEDNLLRYSCLHGVGHGLRGHNNLTLKTALGRCDLMKEKKYAGICVGGAYMENMSQNLYLSEEELKLTIPSLCSEAKEAEDKDGFKNCVQGIGTGLLYYALGNQEKINQFCSLITEKGFKEVCIASAEKERVSSTLE